MDDNERLESYDRDRWRCSACDRLNSMVHDNACPRCMGLALEDDAEKLAALSAESGND